MGDVAPRGGRAVVDYSKAVEFAIALPSVSWTDIFPLLEKNHAEVGALESAAFKPDYHRLVAMERAGMTRGFTMKVSGEAVGYALFLVISHWHYPGTKWALQDAMFVSPNHRGIRAVEFMVYQDEALKQDGVDIIVRQVPTKSKVDFSKMLTRFGYTPVEKSFMRDLRLDRISEEKAVS